MIPIAKPLLGKEEKEAVLEVLDSGMLTQGTYVKEFEERFAEFIGVKQAVAASSGTTALHAALLTLGIKEGDEVITSPFTFIATATAIKMVGAKPVFVDIDEKTFNIDVSLVEKVVTEKTKAIIPVHLFGLPVDMEALGQVATKHNLLIVEDACQAHGAHIKGRKVGSFGVGCFSFYPTKNMTTGEGGMITVDDPIVAEKLRKIINHGSSQRYYHDSLGYNYRMTNIAAAIGIEQLKKLEQFTALRRRNASFLSEKISNCRGIIVPLLKEGHVFHQFTIRVTKECGKTRDELKDYLTTRGIGSAVYYPLPLHKQGAFREYNYLYFPVAEKIAKEVISLPIHPGVSWEEMQKIADVFEILK